ncbi:MAG: glycosyltransferase family 39 protein [Acidobacteriota bacterium]
MNAETRTEALQRGGIASIAAALLVGLGLRLRDLTAGALQLDEGYTVVLASADVGTILRTIATDPNPVLSSLAYKLWTALFGTSELAWESFAVLVGIVGLGVLTAFAARVFGPPCAVAAAWIGAFSPLHVYFSQQVRGYALVMLWGTLAAWTLLRDLRSPSPRRAAGFVIAANLLVATHYYGLLVVAALLSGAFLAHPGGRLRTVGLGGAFTVVAIPTLFCLYLQYTVYYGFYWIPKPAGVLVENAVFRLAGGNRLLVGIAALTLVAGALWVARRPEHPRAQHRRAFAVLFAWLAMPAVLAVAASVLGKAFFHSRYIVVCLPPVILLLAFGLSRLPRRSWRAAATALVCLLCLPRLLDQHRAMVGTAPEQAAYERVSTGFQEGDVVLHVTKESFVPALFHHGLADGRRLPEYFLQGTPTSNVMVYWLPHPTELSPGALAGYRRVWVVRKLTEHPRHAERLFQDPRFRRLEPKLVERDEAGGVFLFELTALAPPTPSPKP